MKKGHVILGAAALVVTAASAFTSKSANKSNTRHQLFGSYVTTGPNKSTICTKVTCWTIASGVSASGVCHTTVNKSQAVRATYTSRTAVNNVLCQNAYTGLKTKVH